MKMTKQDTLEHDAELSQVLKMEFELNFQIIRAARKTKNKLASEANEIKDILSDFRKREQQLDLKYCDKDNDEKPIIIRVYQLDKNGDKVLVNEHFSGLEIGNNPDYDKEKDELIDARNALLKEEIDIEIFTFNESVVPKKGPMNILSAICFLIADDSKEE